ncbi:hypothetical protein [Simiduia agarivorans]|uniref:Uncharacterized protein n=1 Tax=Simiduia agarivorans (strain DSM 21679 / JCM 13881 / BCRC 17597 / SA1) TaxID=1117647 RepID=K4L0Z0_SIMAS|nr:hypothetical protein [Simiduia agarivorans]AFU99832.2 hypothetical protein M5M_13440 [Simiduia agarivorans SA1 = DSM 21679]
MKRILLVLLVVFSLSVKAEVLWKPEAISYQLKQAHKILGYGLMLELNQALNSGEKGWRQSRIDVPESWVGALIEMKGGTIYITVGTDIYYLNSTNKGELSFAILDGGKKTDANLLEIWAKYAKST